MPITRSLFRGLVVALAVGATGPTAHAASETAAFNLTVSGIKAGTMSLDTTRDGKSYTARARVNAAGLVGAFLTFTYDATATGTVTASGKIVPSRFDASSAVPGNAHKTSITWKGGVPTSVTITPPRDDVPEPSEQGGTLDPASAAVQMLSDGPVAQRCDMVVTVFDGSRLSRLTLGPRTPTKGGFSCAGKYARVKGVAASIASQKEFPFQLVFSESGGVARLQRIETSTSFGKAVLSRQG